MSPSQPLISPIWRYFAQYANTGPTSGFRLKFSVMFELHFTLGTTCTLFSKHKIILTFQASEKVQKSVFQIIDNYQKKFKTNKIFLSSKQINVYWAHVTVVKAELICFEDLLEFPQANWKYIITTAGSELPNYSHKMLRSDINIKLSLSFNQDTFYAPRAQRARAHLVP